MLSYDDEDPWLEDIDGRATWESLRDVPPDSERKQYEVASCEAKLIRRDQIRESFWLKMEGPSQEMADLAFDLFDRYGRLDREYYGHEFRKGTGVWGKELDHGDILLFEKLRVNQECRRRGLGTKIVNAILGRTREKVAESVGFFAVVRPGFLRVELEREGEIDPEKRRKLKGDLIQISETFWQSLGFRRVGTSLWFARTDSPGHPSQHLEVSQDWKYLEMTGDASFPDGLNQIFAKLADPAVEETECIIELRKIFPEDCEHRQRLIVNQDGNTLLHIAAMSSKPGPVKFIISKVAHLAVVRNREGYTPLEALRNRLEHQRTR